MSLFLDPAAWPAWKLCPGRAALEEGEPADGEYNVGFLSTEQIEAVDLRRDAFLAGGAVRAERILGSKLDVGIVTGERAAIVVAPALLLAERKDDSIMEVFGWRGENLEDGGLAIMALAAVVKYQMLHNFVAVNLCAFEAGSADFVEITWPLDLLYSFGQQVTEAAAVALGLRGGAAALSNLVPGDIQCKDCRVAYRCPALARKLLLGEDDGEIA